jgi:hypothetical protein
MRTRDLILLLASVALFGNVASAQPPANPPQLTKPADPLKNQPKPTPAPDSLEALTAEALKHNPSIQAATAALREADAKLAKTRNEVLVEVAAAHKVLVQGREVLRQTEDLQKMREDSYKKGNLSSFEFAQGKIELARAAATLATLEADLMKLVGHVPAQPLQHTATQNPNLPWSELAFSPEGQLWGRANINQPFSSTVVGQSGPYYLMTDGGVRVWDTNALVLNNALTAYNPRAVAPAASIADKIKEALQHPIKIDKERHDTVKNVLNFLKEQGLKDVPVRMMANEYKVFEMPCDLMAGDLPLSAWLQAVQDSAPELRIVVREYGLLVTTVDRAPPDGLLLGDFLRRAKNEKPKEEKKDEKPKQ